MATREVAIFEEQTSITGTSDQFVVLPDNRVSAVAKMTASGTATLQMTVDPVDVIEANNATWVDSAYGLQAASFADAAIGPVTGIRLNVASGTWTLKVLQA
ncbi:MAG: hypothetical protein OXR68_04245 [Alphaproteobacteria bacterium]|nr:hypothetical protein [Alphaproteobacteria bacterium]MDD9919818.1 hypothetical protein [Alphaproteobacteria bacterium]